MRASFERLRDKSWRPGKPIPRDILEKATRNMDAWLGRDSA